MKSIIWTQKSYDKWICRTEKGDYQVTLLKESCGVYHVTLLKEGQAWQEAVQFMLSSEEECLFIINSLVTD